MHISNMTIMQGSHPAFGKDIELELDEQVNLFIGPNACGKTSILRVLAEAVFLNNATMIPFNAPKIIISEDWALRFESPTEADSQYLEVSQPLRIDGRLLVVPWIYIPATRVALPGEFDEEAIPFNGDEIVDGIFEDRLSVQWPDNSQIFNNAWVEHLVRRMFDQFKGGSKEFGQYRYMLRLSGRCARRIAGETITGGLTNYVTDPSDLFGPDEVDPLAVEPYLHPGMGVFTKVSDLSAAKLQYAGNLSSGTQGIFLWVLYVALRMAHHYRFEKGWDKNTAILLIDEIENHLHPTWQRRVIPALLDHFPGLQIFATTHSPFVVAGLKAGQVHVLNRDTNGVVTASTNERDVIGWTADEILRGMMGVEEPTDQLTVDRANRLRELREKDELNEQEEEELNRLRRHVNEDLLNKRGPLEAQRERYADLVQDFLRMRQSELTQDGE